MNWALDTECVNVMNKVKYKIRIFRYCGVLQLKVQYAVEISHTNL